MNIFKRLFSGRKESDQSSENENGSDIIVSSTGIVLKWCPPGRFFMNRESRFADDDPDFGSSVDVVLNSGFWIGVYPVTQEQWVDVMGTNPSKFVESGINAPVDSISWDMAMMFCESLTERESNGWIYTLPSEAQWEYAYRAGSQGSLRFEPEHDIGWFAGNSSNQTHPVGEWGPNEWGLYDMAGNVWEWCFDYKAEIPVGPLQDPIGPTNALGESTNEHVLLGGCYRTPCDISMIRTSGQRSWTDVYFGFRVVLRAADSVESDWATNRVFEIECANHRTWFDGGTRTDFTDPKNFFVANAFRDAAISCPFCCEWIDFADVPDRHKILT